MALLKGIILLLGGLQVLPDAIELLIYNPPAAQSPAITFVTQSFLSGSLMIGCPNKNLADSAFYQVAEIKTGWMRLTFSTLTTRLTTKLRSLQQGTP
jgi:hypothetical protein